MRRLAARAIGGVGEEGGALNVDVDDKIIIGADGGSGGRNEDDDDVAIKGSSSLSPSNGS